MGEMMGVTFYPSFLPILPAFLYQISQQAWKGPEKHKAP